MLPLTYLPFYSYSNVLVLPLGKKSSNKGIYNLRFKLKTKWWIFIETIWIVEYWSTVIVSPFTGAQVSLKHRAALPHYRICPEMKVRLLPPTLMCHCLLQNVLDPKTVYMEGTNIKKYLRKKKMSLKVNVSSLFFLYLVLMLRSKVMRKPQSTLTSICTYWTKI